MEHDTDWFLAQLETDFDSRELENWLFHQKDKIDPSQWDSLAGFLQDTLTENNDLEAAIRLLACRAAFAGVAGEEKRRDYEQAVTSILGAAPEVRSWVESAGFDDPQVPLAECFRRLQVLRHLKPDVLCYDGTWGAGSVRDVDWFYRKVAIDFEKKKEHEMSFAYAAETLLLLDEDHFLTWVMKKREELDVLIDSNPAEVVRMVLRSFGDMPVALLQESLVPRVFDEKKWKSFWEQARKTLKKDPLFEIPSKRSEPLRILHKEKAFDDEWFETLLKERRIETLLEMFDEYMAEGDPEERTLEQTHKAEDRLRFIMMAAARKRWDWIVSVLRIARTMNLVDDVLNDESILRDVLESKQFHRASDQLSARDVPDFIQMLVDREGQAAYELLLREIPLMNTTLLNVALDVLIQQGREDQCAAVIRELTGGEKAESAVLYWLYRNPEKLKAWNLGGLPQLARWMMRALEKDVVGEELKIQNQLRNRFEQADWLSDVLDAMTVTERREFMRMINESTSWELLEKRSLMGKLIKLDTSLQSVISSSDDKAVSVDSSGLLTSQRSYTERQKQLEKITIREIPEVAKEIGVARSYGDLRENFEYKAAKDKQALLLQRKGELEAMLDKVRPTDFAEVSTDQVGQGNGVIVEYPDGQQETFFVLGVWDRDEKLNVISSDSRMAQVLIGNKAGERVVIPTEHGEQEVVVKEILPLSSEVRAWIQAE